MILARSDLMAAIRNRGGFSGVDIEKKIEQESAKRGSNPRASAEEDDSLTNVLKGALNHIQQAALMSSSDDDSDTSDSWSDTEC